jgi:zinc and cadmium transporter
MTLSILTWIILMTSINGLIALAGGFTLLLSKKSLDKIILILVSLSIGGLLGGAIFHFIPEAIEEISILLTSLLIITGILIFFLTEKLLHWHHCHKNGKCEKHPFTHLILIGDGVHNFIDGLVIAASFIISIPLGILTSILIMAHELPQELGDFGVLVHGGFTRTKALLYNFLSQLTAILGGILGYFFLSLKDYSIYLLPVAAGGFLYIAIADLIPEVFKEKNKIKLIMNILAIIIGLLVLISAKKLIG